MAFNQLALANRTSSEFLLVTYWHDARAFRRSKFWLSLTLESPKKKNTRKSAISQLTDDFKWLEYRDPARYHLNPYITRFVSSSWTIWYPYLEGWQYLRVEVRRERWAIFSRFWKIKILKIRKIFWKKSFFFCPTWARWYFQLTWYGYQIVQLEETNKMIYVPSRYHVRCRS